MKKRLFFVFAATLAAIALFSWVSGRQSGHDGHAATEAEAHDGEEADVEHIRLTEKQIQTTGLRLSTVEQRQLNTLVTANGSLVLRPGSKGEVAALMGGLVRSILVREGQAVQRGQVVATIENTDIVSLQREYFTASRQADLARQEVDRQQTLAQNGAGVRKTLQQAQSDLRVAQATLTGIGRQLAQLGISTKAVAEGRFVSVFQLRAPISGTVSRLSATVGAYADMQTPLMQICDNSAVECDLNVFERDLQKISNGDRVALTLSNQSGVSLSGTVYGMNDHFNDGTKSVAVHVRLDAAPGVRLFDGMYVAARIATGRKQCEALPAKAIVNVEGKSYIFALNKDKKGSDYEFSRHEVTTGVSEDGYTQVSLCKHLTADSQIVTDNAFYLASLTGEHGEHAH